MNYEKLYSQYCKYLIDVGENRARSWLECDIYNILRMQRRGVPWRQVLDVAYEVIHYAK